MQFVISFLIIVFSIVVQAQGSTGADDGGNGVICRNAYESARSDVRFNYTVEFLDLYESRRLFRSKPRVERLKFGAETLTPGAQYEVCAVLRSRAFAMRDFINQYPELTDVFDKSCVLAKNVKLRDKLSETRGYGEIMWPVSKDCRIIQLASRNSNSVVNIHEGYAEYLSTTDMAALLLHESLHEVFENQTSNLAVRQMVMFVFAPKRFRELNWHLAEELLRARQPVSTGRWSSFRRGDWSLAQ